MNEKNILISVKLDENKIASRLKEIKTAMNNLEKDNQKLQNAIDKLGDSTGNFSKAIETNNNKIKSLQGEYTRLESKLSDNNKATQDLANKTSNLSKAEEKLSSSVKDSSSSLNANEKELNKVGDALNKNESSTNQLASSQEKLGSSFTNNSSKVKQFESELGQANKKIDEFKNNVSQIESKTVNINVKVNTETSGSTDISSDNISSSMQNMDTDVNSLEMGLTKTLSAVNVLKQGFVSLGMEGAASISNIVSEVGTLAVSIAKKDYAGAIASGISLLGNVFGELGKRADSFTGQFVNDWSILNKTFKSNNKIFEQDTRESFGRVGDFLTQWGIATARFIGNIFTKGIGKSFSDAVDQWIKHDDLVEFKEYSIETFKELQELSNLTKRVILDNEDEIREYERVSMFADEKERLEIEDKIKHIKLENLEEEYDFAQQQLDAYETALIGVYNINNDTNVKDMTPDVMSSLSQEEIDKWLQLKDAVSQTKDEYIRYRDNVEILGDSLEKQYEILDRENSIREKKRNLTEEEIDLGQKIIELTAAGADEAEIIEVQKQALQSKIDLIKEEIELQELVGDKSNQDDIDKLHALQMELKKTTNDYNNLALSATTASQAMTQSTSMLDKITDSVGESSQALSLLGITGAASIKRIAVGLKALGKLFTTWPLVAIVAIITVVATVVKGVSKAFKENEALTKRLKDAFAAFEPILEIVQKSFEVLAELITFITEGFATLVRTIFGTQEAWESEQRWIRETQAALEALNKAKRQYEFDEIERDQKIVELSQIVKDKELKDIDERVAAQRRINEIKLESLKADQKNKEEQFRLANEKIKKYEEIQNTTNKYFFGLIQTHKKLTEEQQEDYDKLIEKLDDYEKAVKKANYAIINSYADAKNSIMSILSELTTEQIKEKIKQLEASRVSTDEEIKNIKQLQKQVRDRIDLEEAVLYLRKKGVALTAQEAKDWDTVYDRLIQITPVDFIGHQVVDDRLKELREALEISEARDKRNTTTTTKTTSGESEEEKQRKREAEELAKYWAKVLDDSEKGLSAFLKEIQKADKEFRELSMNPIEIFDMNLDESLKTLDARKAEIQKKIEEITNKPTNTDEEREQQQQALARYTQMYAEFETLRTAITQKAAKERAKLEEEMTKENLEHRLTEIERYYKRQKEEMMANPLDISGGETFTFFKNSEIDEAKMNLAQAKDEVNALKEALLELEPGTEAYEEMANRIVDANIKVIEKNKELINSVANTAATYMGAMDEITGSISSLMAAKKKEVQNSKKSEAEKEALIHEYEEKEKQMTVAQIAFSTATAIAKGIADAMTLMYPANLAAMASTIAAIIAGIAQAKSAMAGYQEGGIIPGNSYTGDKVLIRSNSDEMVLTKKQQTELFRIANGRGGSGNQFYMVKAFEKALSRMPSPTLDYSEFSTFTTNVNSMNNLVKIK